MDVLATLFSELIKTLWANGPLGMIAATAIVGWGIAVFLFFKSRSKTKRTEPTAIDHVNDIKKLHDKYQSLINDLNEKYNISILDISEKRIGDLKDLNASYNSITRDLLATLDKIANNVKILDDDEM